MSSFRANKGLRNTLLLGLGPLLSLWALGTQISSAPALRAIAAPAHQQITDSLDRLLHPVFSFLMLAASHAPSSTNIRTPQAMLALEALKTSRLGGSIWLVRSDQVNLLPRPVRKLTLRC